MSIKLLKRTSKKLKKTLKVGCLAMALITSWGAGGTEADAYYYNAYGGTETNINTGATVPLHITGSVTPTQDITNAYLITDQFASYCASCVQTHSISVFSLGNLVSNNTSSFAFDNHNYRSLDTSIGTDYYSVSTYYTVVGLYDNANSAVVGIAGTVTGGWDTLFPWGPSESFLITALGKSDPGADLAYFMFYGDMKFLSYNALGNNYNGAPLNLYGFSDATPLGAVHVDIAAANPVPVPDTLMLLLPGLAIVPFLRRRKRTA
jgi:hypothetical protein